MSYLLESMGYIPMTQTEFNEAEEDITSKTFNKIYEDELKKDFSFDKIDYNFIDVKKITINEDGLCDIDFEDKNINLSYLEWYYSKDYIKGIEWYKKHLKHIPMINEMAYLLVKADIKNTSKLKLEKYEIHQLRQYKKKQDKVEAEFIREEKKLIRQIQNDKMKNIKFEKKNVLISFNNN